MKTVSIKIDVPAEKNKMTTLGELKKSVVGLITITKQSEGRFSVYLSQNRKYIGDFIQYPRGDFYWSPYIFGAEEWPVLMAIAFKLKELNGERD